jgi:hypothetical protein
MLSGLSLDQMMVAIPGFGRLAADNGYWISQRPFRASAVRHYA